MYSKYMVHETPGVAAPGVLFFFIGNKLKINFYFIDILPIISYTIYEVRIMEYLSVSDMAKKWNLSERTVRDYCAKGRIEGAFLKGKTWSIPEAASKPERINSKNTNHLLETLRREKMSNVSGGIYHKLQIEMTYNSNHMEGSQLTHDQTRYIYETNTIGMDGTTLNVDDIVETTNHFRCIDCMIEQADHQLSQRMIKELHQILKSGTTDSRKDGFQVGEYKKLPNEVGGKETVLPENVESEIKKLLEEYKKIENKSFDDLLDFHVRFERIHPFQDGNGRIGRLLLLKECLKHNIVPCIITDDLKMFYYRGLDRWSEERGYLRDTCLTGQDKVKEYLDYFKIPYKE